MKKACHVFAFFLLAAPAVWANVYLPNAKLVGETVQVRLLADSAVVTAAFEFDDWITSDAKRLYIPLFAREGDDPIDVLSRARLDLVIRGKEAGLATPCKAPRAVGEHPTGVKVFWFVLNLDEFEKELVFLNDAPLVVRVTYHQPLLGGRFYYLPVIPGFESKEKERRSWSYQLFARCSAHVIRVFSPEPDYERYEDGVVWYLRDGQLVVLE
jgi:hypothetical protein